MRVEANDDMMRVIARIRYSLSDAAGSSMPKLKTTPRKTAIQARAQATVDAILSATARILVKDGYDHASTNKVALAAGVSVGSLYQYFPSKEALVVALIQRHGAEMRRVLSEAFVRIAGAPIEEAVREMVVLMARAHAVDPRLHKVLVEQVPRVGRLEQVHAFEDEVLAMTEQYLAATPPSSTCPTRASPRSSACARSRRSRTTPCSCGPSSSSGPRSSTR